MYLNLPSFFFPILLDRIISFFLTWMKSSMVRHLSKDLHETKPSQILSLRNLPFLQMSKYVPVCFVSRITLMDILKPLLKDAIIFFIFSKPTYETEINTMNTIIIIIIKHYTSNQDLISRQAPNASTWLANFLRKTVRNGLGPDMELQRSKHIRFSRKSTGPWFAMKLHQLTPLSHIL